MYSNIYPTPLQLAPVGFRPVGMSLENLAFGLALGDALPTVLANAWNRYHVFLKIARSSRWGRLAG